MKLLPIVTLLFFSFLGAGCSTTKPIVCTTKEIHIAVPVIDAPPNLPAPQLSITSVNSKSSNEDVVRAYAATIKALEDYTKQLQEIVQHYADEAKTNKDNK